MGNTDSRLARRAGQIIPPPQGKPLGRTDSPALPLSGQEFRRAFTAFRNSSRSIGLGKYPSGGGTRRLVLMNFS